MSRFNRPILVVDYDVEWPIEFDRERKRIADAIGKRPAVFEHIGSTSVPGLVGKPVIDIAIGIPDLAAAPDYIAVLTGVGYEYVPEFEAGLPRRRFLWRGTQQIHTHHIHIAEIGNRAWIEPLTFRDYLRNNPSVATEYGDLKKRLAEQCGEDIAAYIAGKSDFVTEVHRRVGLA